MEDLHNQMFCGAGDLEHLEPIFCGAGPPWDWDCGLSGMGLAPLVLSCDDHAELERESGCAD